MFLNIDPSKMEIKWNGNKLALFQFLYTFEVITFVLITSVCNKNKQVYYFFGNWSHKIVYIKLIFFFFFNFFSRRI